jgi:uncharacterized protein (DUF427 family)
MITISLMTGMLIFAHDQHFPPHQLDFLKPIQPMFKKLFSHSKQTISSSPPTTMPTATAKVNGTTIATAPKYETVEGNVYFPQSSIDQSVAKLSPSNTHTTCPWKGKADYYNITVDGKEIKDAAWYYPSPKDKAAHIKDHVAFCEC